MLLWQHYLDSLWYTCAVHATRHIYSVPPDVVLRFPGPDHPSHHRADVKTYDEKLK